MNHFLSLSLVILAAFPIAVAQTAGTRTNRHCEDKVEHRQLDFWIGEWEVTSEGKKVATSSIQRIIGGCVIFENYTQPGYEGKSFTFYDSALKQWRQTWVDDTGNVSEFSGSLKNGAMELEGVTHLSDGRTVMRRMTLTPIPEGRVRQFSQRSFDAGKTWTIAYDFIYVPKVSK